MGKLVQVKNVFKSFGDVHAVNGVSLDIQEGQFYSLLGPSGCGKTTLLRLIAGFEHPTSGTILLNDQDISLLPPNKRPVNTVFQSYALFPHMTVAGNISFGLEMLGWSRERVSQTVDEMLDALIICHESQEIGVVLISGEGPSPKDGGWAFCSGGDQRVRAPRGYKGSDGVSKFNILDVQRQIRFMNKVVIAAVPGWAVGGGHSLHVVCDLTLASKEHAIFKQTDVDVASFDGGFGSAYLARQVGQKRAREIFFLGFPLILDLKFPHPYECIFFQILIGEIFPHTSSKVF